MQTRCGNKYYITFVDDNMKYCYVYLLKSKDEVIEKFFLYKNEIEIEINLIKKSKYLKVTEEMSMSFHLPSFMLNIKLFMK